MRIYFLTCKPAILKLNGLYAGGTDLFERHIEADLKDNILAEIVPGDNLQPVNFFLNEKILENPPGFADVYLMDGDALIYVKRFSPRETRLKVIYQTRFEGTLVTVFSQGDVYLSAEGAEYNLYPLSESFNNVRAEQKTIAGFPVLVLWGGEAMVIISHTGTQIFANEVVFAEFGNTLKTGVRFETCTAAQARCEYSYDGEKLTLIASRTLETSPTDESILHFAFFESVLTYADFTRYLSSELCNKAADLRAYLGEFIGVTVPTEKFCALHPGERAAGLVYRKAENLFEIKYYAVLLKDGKIDNIYPVE